jgi:hypothetical protein
MNQEVTKMKIQNAVMLIFTTHSWGNRKKADTKKIETSAEKSFLSLSKRLIDSDKYKSILNFQNEVYNWINKNAVPSFFLRGSYLFNISMVEEVEQYLKAQSDILKEKIKPLLAEYEQKIAEAEQKLGDQFNFSDYPNLDVLKSSFSFSWKWTIFDIPEGLPEKIFQEEKLKAENMWRESAEQISLCLRQAFVELIKHANSMLEPNADGKTKGFKNSSFDNIDEFISTFKNRNIVDDKELENLVEQARKILTNIDDPQQLKKDKQMKEIVSKNFSEITSKLDEMIAIKPSRKFDLD